MCNYYALYWKSLGCYEKVEPEGHCLTKILHLVVAFISFPSLSLSFVSVFVSPSLSQMDILFGPIVFEWVVILSVL